VHCFTGTTEELQRYADCGFFIGLTGYVMTLDDEKLLLWLNMITLDKLVIETDAPYMGFKGCRSSESKEKKRTYPNVPVALVKVLNRICAVSGNSCILLHEKYLNSIPCRL
jgi:TatD DNase family protein